MKTHNLEPILCIQRDKETLKYCLDRITISEPTSIITVGGNGKDIIFENLISKLKSGLPVISKYVVDDEGLNKLLLKLKNQTPPFIALINLTIGHDVSWVLKEIENIRRKYSSKFTYLLFSYFGDIKSAYISKEHPLSRSLKILQPIDLPDVKRLINDLARRYSYKPSAKQTSVIYTLSGGHIGLIKSLYLLLRSNPNLSLNEQDLVNEQSIISRLESINNNLAGLDVADFRLNSTLLSRYKQKGLESEYLFSQGEMPIYEFLLSKKGKIISREDIAKIIWSNNWENKYSDWAIDQIIHRLRAKIKAAKFPYKLLTKKGIGFILLPK